MTEQQTRQGGSVRKAVEKRQAEPRPIAIARSYERDFAAVLPQHIEAPTFLGAAIGVLRKNSDLMKAAEANPASFMNSLLECAQLGHSPGSKEYALTKRVVGGRETIVGIEQYQGVIERMYRSGAVASVIVREVCKGDGFRFVEGEMDKPVHEVDWFNGGARDQDTIIGCYAYAILTTGAVSRVVVLSRKDLDDAKARSDMGKKDKGPWHDHFRAMCLKTAAHRLEPWVPTSAEYRASQLRASAEADRVRQRSNGDGDYPADGDVLDAEVVGEEGGSADD